MELGEWNLEVTGSLRDFDEAEVTRAVGIFLEPGSPYAIQALYSARWDVVASDRMEHLLYTVGEFADEAGVYFGINPLRSGFVKPPEKGWTNPDVGHRRWLLVDVDPNRPEGMDKRTNSADVEKKAARAVAGRIATHLTARGWPPPIEVDSGNGTHLYWRMDASNDKLSQQALSKLLKALATQFDTPEAHVDTAVHDAKRIAKLPGTWARKGPHSEERPHRLCRIVFAPAVVQVVPLEMIRQAAGITANDSTPEPAADDSWSVPVTRGDGGSGYAQKAMADEITAFLMVSEGRNTALMNAAIKLGNFVASGLLREDEVIARLTAAARANGLPDPADPEEIERAIGNGLAIGKQYPRTAPDKGPGSPATGAAGGKLQTIDPSAADALATLLQIADTFETRPVEWLWPNRIPIGKLTTLAGSGGLGKSFVLTDLAGRITNGAEIPFGGGECFPEGNVIIVNCEDDPEDTTVPRLIEAGANLKKVGILRPEALNRFTLGDIPMLKRAVAEMGDVKLIVIDPATAFVGKADDHRNSELQALLGPLRVAAWEMGAAICLVTHVSKPTGNKVEAAARVIGGVAWVNAVRAGLIFLRDPKDKTKRLMIPFKTNNGPEVGGLRYRIQTTETLAKIEWEGTVDIDADDAMSTAKEGERITSAEAVDAFIRGLFRESLSVASSIIKDHAKEEGVSWRALEAAKNRLGIKPRKHRMPNGVDAWFWEAPAEWLQCDE